MRMNGVLTALLIGGSAVLGSVTVAQAEPMANPCNPCAGMTMPAKPAHAYHVRALKAVHLNQPIVAMIEADWCPSCKHIKPTLMSLMSKYGKQAKFLKLDVTNERTKAQSAALAKAYGLSAFFNENQSRTSTIGVFAAKSRVPVKVLVGEADAAPYVEALKTAEKH